MYIQINKRSVNMQYTFANKLLTKLAQQQHVTLERVSDTTYSITVDLGTGWAGDYAGGYWGDCSITDDTLCFYTTIASGADNWDDETEWCFYEGIVQLTYKGGTSANGLAYTGELENAINASVQERTGGLLQCDGSEQGMQGHSGDDESYLSLDVWCDDEYYVATTAAATA
jgi:hypothetical protein